MISEGTKKKISEKKKLWWASKTPEEKEHILRGAHVKGKVGILSPRYGKKHTEESKRKMSLARMGKGRGVKSPEHCKRLSEALKGRKCSEHTKQVASKTHKGKKIPPHLILEMSERFKGDKNPSWIDGRSKVAQSFRNTVEYSLWRSAVLARDNWTCQKCNKRGGKLHVHHIKSFSQFPELRVAIDNGQTLCPMCHAIVDPFFARVMKNQQAQEASIN